MKRKELDFSPIFKKLAKKLNNKKFKDALKKALKIDNSGQKLVQKMYGGKIKDRKSVYQGMTKPEMAAITKRPMGGKVYKNTVARKHGGQIGTPRGIGKALRGYGKGYK